MRIAVVTEPLETVVQIGTDTQRQRGHDEEKDDSTKETISAVHHKPKEDKALQMAHHSGVETKDPKGQEEDRILSADIGPTYGHLKQKVMDLLRNFTDM